MKQKRLFAGILVLAIVIGLLPAISPAVFAAEASETYTFHDYTTELGTNWNPHAWQTAGDEALLQYLQTPFVDYTIKDSATNAYQWIFLAATDIRDVTASHQDDLVKYGCDETAATEGYVYEFSLQPEMKWEDGTPINADTYIYSMQALLDSRMQNYQAESYYAGSANLVGARDYAKQGQTSGDPAKELYSVYTTELDAQLIFSLGPGLGANSYLRDYFGFSDSYDLTDTVNWLIANYIFPVTVEEVAQIEGKTLAEIKADASMNATWEAIISWWQTEPNEELDFFIVCFAYPAVDFETVGLYKVDDYTIRYVCQNATAYNDFLYAMTTNWLVYEPMYEACKDLTTTPGTSTYGTSAETTMSYGPYRMETYEAEEQVVFVRNEHYFEYEVDASGNITSATSFTVNGANVSQWTTDKIVLLQMSEAEAREAFLAGELDVWTPSRADLIQYATSERLYKVDQTYTMRLFFNCDLDALKNMDSPNGNRNSAVLSSYNFRKALSMAIDRSAFVTTTPGYKPDYTLFNSMYYYDGHNAPDSIYRNTDQAKRAMCELYDVAYTEENYNAITGYDLEQAKALMAQACQELIAQGLYTEGETVVIRVAWSHIDLSEQEKNQLDCLNYLINEAAKGSGFGKIILEGVAAWDRYKDVPNGVYAIGYGAWDSMNPDAFESIGCYTDAEYVQMINEAGCWDPAETYLTLTVDGVEETMTYTQWTRSLLSYGKYADAADAVKLDIMAQLEMNLLNLYYCIPLASGASGTLLSYKVSYCTDTYNQFCGFGGLRLMRYHYTDAQWEAYIAANELDYSGPACDYAFNYDLDEGKYPITGICGEALTWSLSEDGVLSISGTGDMADYTDWSQIPWYSRRMKIKSVVIESGVTSIGDWAFQFCDNMASVLIPDSVTEIGAYAFSNSDSITEITIPESVTSIGQYAFASCNALNRIVFKGDAPSIGEDAFLNMETIACYPESNATWTEDVLQNYGGTITWVSQSDALEIAQGDVNGDGKVDTTDAKLIMQFDLGIIDETALNLSVADVNGDGMIDTTDAKLIMQFDLGIITAFLNP